MVPSFILIVVAMLGMMQELWKGAAIVAGVNIALGLLLVAWRQAVALEVGRSAPILARLSKFLINTMLVLGLLVLLVFMVDDTLVSRQRGV